MIYLLDTNACIKLLNNSSAKLVSRIKAVEPSRLQISAITKAELLFGARNSSRPGANLRLLEVFFGSLVSLPFDDVCADHYAAIRSDLARAGKPIGPNDLLIAATARAHGLVLITHNTREFGRVAGLAIEDWEA